MIHAESRAHSVKTIAILGGYGRAGGAIARHLARQTDTRLLLVGRDLQRARKMAEQLNAGLSSPRVSGVAADVRDGDALRRILREADIALVCMRTTGFVETVAHAALDTRTDLLDITLNSIETHEVCHRWRHEILRHGRCFITEAGVIPGMPSVFVAYAAAKLGRLKEAIVAELMRLREWGGREGLAGFLEDIHNLTPGSRIYSDGAWRRPRGGGKKVVDFGPPFGPQACYPYQLAELHDLPARYQLEELGQYAAGFGHWMTDWLFVLFVILKVGKRGRGAGLGARVLDWAFRRFSQPPYGLRLMMLAEGVSGETLQVTLVPKDEYEATAIPVVAFLKQWLDGSVVKPGVWMMGHTADPERLIADMEQMGMQIIKKHDGPPA
jgi:hypothetical protein